MNACLNRPPGSDRTTAGSALRHRPGLRAGLGTVREECEFLRAASAPCAVERCRWRACGGPAQ
jgi:hypothetical protein